MTSHSGRSLVAMAAAAALALVGCGSVSATPDGGSDDGGPDTSAPTVVGTTPADQAMNVDYRVNVSVTFSEPIAPATATLVMVPDGGCAPALDAAGTRLSCNNPSDLQPTTQYTVTVPATVTDVAGHPLGQAFTFHFGTSAVPDTTAPTIMTVAPADAAIGTVVRPPLVITFSEPMDQAKVESAFSIVSPLGAVPSFAWSPDGTTLTVTFGSDFAYGDQVVWKLNAAAADLAGNALATQQFTFRVRRSSTVTLNVVDYGNTMNGVLTSGLYVGDTAANQNYRAFLVYTLPSDALEILAASLTLQQSISASNPFSTGTQPLAIYVESVAYTAPIDNAEAVGTPACLGTAIQCTAVNHSHCLDAEVLSTTSTPSNLNSETRSVSSSKFLTLVRTGFGQPGRTFAIRMKRGYLSTYTTSPCDEFFIDSDNVGDYLRYLDPGDGTPANRPNLSITYTYP